MPVMRRPFDGATKRQWLYAQNRLNPAFKTKKEALMASGYPLATAQKPANVENSEGVMIASAHLAADAGNLALAAMEEFKVRGFDSFSDGDLIKALNAIANAYAKFLPKEQKPDDGMNVLREILLQRKAIEVTVDNTVDSVDSQEPNMFDID